MDNIEEKNSENKPVIDEKPAQNIDFKWVNPDTDQLKRPDPEEEKTQTHKESASPVKVSGKTGSGQARVHSIPGLKLYKEVPAETKVEFDSEIKQGKRPDKNRKKKKSRKRTVLKIILSIVLVIVIAAAAAAAYIAYLVMNTKNIDLAMLYSNIEMSSMVYDSDGNEIEKIFYTENRENVSINEIPAVTKNAFIAIEDKTFYEHHGFNITRMIGAVFNKLTGRSAEISGTSTITQQLARNVFLSDVKSQRSLKRKFNEMIYALKIEQCLSKDEILEAYLNTIYLGYGNYGIYAAARSYFDKDVRELDLAESAALAALPQAPDSYALLKDEDGEGLVYLKKYDVYANDMSKDRRNLVLQLMTEQEFITQGEAEEARVDIEDIIKPGSGELHSNEYTYFTDYAISEVISDMAEQYDMTEEEAQRFVYTAGLHIHTTVDPEIQGIINREFEDTYNFPQSEEDAQAAMVITQVGTGRIVAMVGGRGAVGKKLFNRATSPRQPGSSIKPLAVYAAALQKSYECEENGQTFPYIDYEYDRQGVRYWGDYITASSMVIDERMNVNGETWPENFSRRFTGRQTFRTALQQSINTCAVKIQLQVGVQYSMDMLEKFGITTAVDDMSQPVNDMNSAALALGAMTYGTTPLEMANAYSVFPNGGVRKSPVCYTKVTDPMGNVILESSSDEIRVLDEGVAFIMTDCLKSVVSRGIARSANIYGVQAGGKTGTTNDTADIWFCGFVPSYSAALWIGTDHNSQMYTTSVTAASLWSRIMGQIPDVTAGEYPVQPLDVTRLYGEYYTIGTEPGYQYRYGWEDQSDDEIEEPDSDMTYSEDKDDESGGNRAGSDEWVRQWKEENE